MSYPNGDESAYAVTVFDATVIDGTPRPDGDETSDVGWFRHQELPLGQMGGLTKVLFLDLGLGGTMRPGRNGRSSFSSLASRAAASRRLLDLRPTCWVLHSSPTTGP